MTSEVQVEAEFEEYAEKAPLTTVVLELMRRKPLGAAGALIVIVMILMAVFANLLTSYDPTANSFAEMHAAPSAEHWLGTDQFGRDLLSRIIHGARTALFVGFVSAFVGASLGLVLGVGSAYFGGRIDLIFQRVMDVFMAFPLIIMALAVVSIFGTGTQNVIIAITIPEVPRVVRLVRAVVLTIREQPYVEAAVSVGTKLPKILWKHILPNTMAPLIVQATYVCASAIVIESILSFLGAGTPPEVPSWGNIMAEGRDYFQIAPWMIFFPGLLLAITVLAVNILGDGLRDSLDPRIARRM